MLDLANIHFRTVSTTGVHAPWLFAAKTPQSPHSSCCTPRRDPNGTCICKLIVLHYRTNIRTIRAAWLLASVYFESVPTYEVSVLRLLYGS